MIEVDVMSFLVYYNSAPGAVHRQKALNTPKELKNDCVMVNKIGFGIKKKLAIS
jgi:hypothetical protein